MDERIETNTFIDKLIGGIEKGIITTIFGAPATGKSNTCMAIASSIAKERKVIFIDTEGGFSPERVMDLSNKDEEVLKNILVLKPITFDEQSETLKKLTKQDLKDIGVVIVDSIASLYRYERDKRSIQEVNQEFAIQLQRLVVIARKNNIPVIITNHVYTDPVNNVFKMVGGDIVPYKSKTMIELLKNNNERIAILRKHRSIKEGRSVRFEINSNSINAIGELFNK